MRRRIPFPPADGDVDPLELSGGPDDLDLSNSPLEIRQADDAAGAPTVLRPVSWPSSVELPRVETGHGYTGLGTVTKGEWDRANR